MTTPNAHPYRTATSALLAATGVAACVWLGAAFGFAQPSTTESGTPPAEATAAATGDTPSPARRPVGTVSFRNDVVPILTKAGCNQGACHGAASGKDGFSLSLRGYDEAGDHRRLVRERPGRRVNLDVPEESLLLTKALGRVRHTGGARIAPNTPEYETLVRWIEEGAVDDSADAPRLVSLRLAPADRVVVATGTAIELAVVAGYSDGSSRDVTTMCQFKSSDSSTVEVGGNGALTAVAPGEAFVTAALNPMIVGVRVLVPRVTPAADAIWPTERNEIDRHVFAKLRSLGVAPSELCSDAVFVRRVHLDLAGRLPTPDELRTFEHDANPTKRRALVERLVDEASFVDIWTAKWADRLRLRSKPTIGVSSKGARLYHEWIRERFADGTPLDEFATALLTTSGPGFENSASHFYQFETDPLNTAEDVAQVFLGLRLKCARCHNHPFDRWTQDDYYGFAAHFVQVARKKTADPREYSVYVDPTGKVEHPLHGTVVLPRVLGGRDRDTGDRDRRAVLADWLASPNNPYFARHMANIVWDHHFGRGIVEPVDDVRISNPPVNEPLLAALANRLVESDFDLRTLVVEICDSATYQLSSVPNETNEDERRNFACWPVRRLPAEVLLDAIGQVTETPEKLPRLEYGASATRLADGADSTPFLTTFGRAQRNSVCACEVGTSATLSQSLHLVNGDTVNERLESGYVVRRLLDAGASPLEVAEELYRRCLSRPPEPEERAELERALATGDEAADVLEDLFWALLNSKEFLFQH